MQKRPTLSRIRSALFVQTKGDSGVMTPRRRRAFGRPRPVDLEQRRLRILSMASGSSAQTAGLDGPAIEGLSESELEAALYGA